ALTAPACLTALARPACLAALAAPGCLTAPARLTAPAGLTALARTACLAAPGCRGGLAASARRSAGTRAGRTLPSAGPGRRIAVPPPAPVPDHRQLPAKLAIRATTGAYTIKPFRMTVCSHPR